MVAYLLKTPHQDYLDKHGEWLAQPPRSAIMHFRYRDEALNYLIELNAKQPELRAQVVEVQLDDKQRPILIDQGDLARNSDGSELRYSELA